MSTTTATLAELAKEVKITAKRGEARISFDAMDEWQKRSNNWRINLQFRKRRMSLDFFTGEGIHGVPAAAGVLECLLSDASAMDESFDDWCSSIGYDADSRKAKATYDKCVSLGLRLKKMLGGSFEEFQNAER